MLGKDALAWIDEIGALTDAQRFAVSTDRHGLSCCVRSEIPPRQFNYASVSRLQIRLGARDAGAGR